jgi:hypothetical protein
MLSVVNKHIILSVFMLNVVMLNIVMLNVVMLIVVAPAGHHKSFRRKGKMKRERDRKTL